MNQPENVRAIAKVTTKDILKETVTVAGGNLKASTKIFKDSITNKTTWALTAGVFIMEVGVLTYQRYISKKIDDETYKRRIKASFFSNAAGVVGGSAGAFIGSFLGNLICPGIGGYIGSIIVGMASSIGSSMTTDYYLDS